MPDVNQVLHASLAAMLRRASRDDLPEGWLYLTSNPPLSESECILLPDACLDEETDPEDYAASLGFPQEGLDTQTLRDVCRWVERFVRQPSDDEYVRSFTYYLKFDAYLPSLEAPDPPALNETLLKLDREFYDGLGEERSTVPCRREGCDRGAITLSVFCRKHHFENIMRRPCPFD